MAKNDKKTKTDDEDIKQIDTSDLSPEELQAAIEKQASSADKPKPKAAPEASNSDSGTPIIVHRRDSYMSRTEDTAKSDQSTPDSEVKKSPPEDKKTIKPPSSTPKRLAQIEVTEIPKSDENPTDNKADEPEITDSKPAETSPEAEPVAAKTTPVEATQPSATDNQTDTSTATANTSVEPPVTPPAPSLSPETATKNDLSVSSSKKENTIQKPTVFDTTQYHLPIKARNQKYMSNVIAWTILTLVFVGVGVYVMIELGVLDRAALGF